MKFSVDQEPNDQPTYTVLKTKIALEKKEALISLLHSDFHQLLADELWHVNVMEGHARIHVVCEQLSWEIANLSPEEKWFYS